MKLLLCSIVFFPMVAGLVSYGIGKVKENIRDYFADVVTGVEFGVLAYLLISTLSGMNRSCLVEIPGVCGLGLHLELDGFRILYGTIAAFMWFMSTLFSKEYFAHYRNQNRYYLFLLLTLGATEGVFLSADFYTTFLFFEIMSFTSYVWVAHDEKKDSLRAAATYLGIAVIGGLVMLMGIFLVYHEMGTLLFTDLKGCFVKTPSTTLWVAGICMLFGFGAKAGAFPLHVWLPKAHPVAPAPASALLSGILTKAGMFGILALSGYLFLGSPIWGGLILIIGVCTMITGAVLALFSIDLKRTLACSSVSQIGFILVGVGMFALLGEEGIPAYRGSVLHMVNHSLIKLALFMAAGVVFMNVHQLGLNEIRGFGRKKPLLNYIFLMGAMGIGGIPLWNGYVSKTLIHESIVEYTKRLSSENFTGLFSANAMQAVEWSFLLSGGLTVAYMLKLYIALFIEKNQNPAVQEKFDSLGRHYMNPVSATALAISATLLPLMGFLPTQVMGTLADLGQSFLSASDQLEEISWFSMANLKGAAISIGAGVLIYLLLVRTWMMKREENGRSYVNRWNRYFDLENLIYRPVLLYALPFLLGILCRVLDSMADTLVVFLRKTIYRDSRLPHELEEGTRVTYLIGSFMNQMERLANAVFWKRRPRKVDFEHKLAMVYEELSEDSTIIGRSLSFGLLLFCIGLIITVVYLLV